MEEHRMEGHHMHNGNLPCSACPRHRAHVWGCLCCYACLRITKEAPRSTLLANDLVHLRMMLVAAVRVLQKYNLPVDSGIVARMLRMSLEEGLQFVPGYVSQELFDADHIDNPFPAPPPRPTLPSSSRSSCVIVIDII